MHWWTIAMFPIAGIFVGSCHAIAAHTWGIATIYSNQPIVGVAAALCVIGSWLAR